MNDDAINPAEKKALMDVDVIHGLLKDAARNGVIYSYSELLFYTAQDARFV
jgi:hypothetical protein